jgi:hypothetical protein
MAVVALVPIRLFRRLQSGSIRAAELHLCSDASGAQEILVRGNARALIVDPSHLTENALFDTVAAAEGVGAAVVVYTLLDRALARRLLSLDEKFEFEAVFQGADDEAVLLARLIATSAEPTVPRLVRHGLTQLFRQLPGPLLGSVLGLFGWLPIPKSATKFFPPDPGTRRTSERQLRRAGLAAATRLLKCARLAKAWEVARSDGASAANIAEVCGFGSKRTLQVDFHHIVGMSLHEAKRALRSPDFARLITRAACTEKR